MAAVSETYLFRCMEGKIQDMPDGGCRVVRGRDQNVMSVQPDGSVQWRPPDTYGPYERALHRDNGVDFWPEGYDRVGFYFAVKEP